tara:strand:+ start:148 stop:255 length:108 start_codon:yes stop_codon:yes gene_type:complete
VTIGKEYRKVGRGDENREDKREKRNEIREDKRRER